MILGSSKGYYFVPISCCPLWKAVKVLLSPEEFINMSLCSIVFVSVGTLRTDADSRAKSCSNVRSLLLSLLTTKCQHDPHGHGEPLQGVQTDRRLCDWRRSLNYGRRHLRPFGQWETTCTKSYEHNRLYGLKYSVRALDHISLAYKEYILLCRNNELNSGNWEDRGKCKI